jgi:hypothetical protein
MLSPKLSILNLSVLTDFVKFINCRPAEQRFVAEVFNMMLIDIRQPGWVGCELAFLALGKVGFVFGFCVPCHVLKIAWGRVGKVMGDCICAGCSLG